MSHYLVAAVRLPPVQNLHPPQCRFCTGLSVIEAKAKRRLADEYDAAQERGEVAKNGGNRGNQFASVPQENTATAADIGLSRKDVHEARIIRDGNYPFA